MKGTTRAFVSGWIEVTLLVILSFTVCGCVGQALGAQMALQVLHEFFPGNGAPRFPSGRLVQGEDGCFYGTSPLGGEFDAGTVFKVTTHGVVNVEYSFDGTPYDNGPAFGGMTVTASGDFYGNYFGQSYPTPVRDTFRFRTNGIPKVEFPWNGTGEYGIRGGLAYDGAENLYGTATQGGSNHLGSVLRITTNGTFAVMISFDGTNGSLPFGSVVLGKDANLYGTTAYGGVGFDGSNFSGLGTVFKLTTDGTLTTLAYFAVTNGSHPYAGLTEGNDGCFYGTTVGGGAFACGTVFRITSAGVLTTLASFNGTNGANPYSEVAQLPSGELYGLTTQGPAATNAFFGSFGTAYRVATNGVISTIANFNGTNAQNPIAELCLTKDGNLYGLSADLGRHLSLNGNAGIFFRLAQVPQITTQTISNGTVILHWTAFTNGVYRVERKSGVWSNNWVALVPNVTALGGTASFTDLSPLPGGSYYRVVLLP